MFYKDLIDEPKLKEECGVFAVFNNEKAIDLVYQGLHALQHRGQEGAGIAFSKNGIQVVKGMGLLSEVFDNDKLFKNSSSNAIGHVRYSTSGGNTLENVQPFVFNQKKKKFALAHNGNIINDYELKEELEEMGTVLTSTSDTEILGHFLIREKGSMHDALLKVIPKFTGAFNFVILEEDAIHIVRDRWGFRPLSIGKKNNSWIVTSETCALTVIRAEFVRDVKQGEIITITKDGIKSSIYDQDSKLNICAMEYIYFARPDSDIEGINVHSFRKECGKKLAKEHPIKADIVIAVPDSSISAAAGYSEESGLPNEIGLVKNRYVARTFIEPTQDQRELMVLKKLSPVIGIVKNKKIVLIDDSIVRGTSIKKIIDMLRFAGAKEVHVRIASPKIIAPSYYGIDISTYDELIGYNRSKKEIRDLIKADSLEYLSLESLIAAAHPIGIDTCIFTNKYPTKISKEIKELLNYEK